MEEDNMILRRRRESTEELADDDPERYDNPESETGTHSALD